LVRLLYQEEIKQQKTVCVEGERGVRSVKEGKADACSWEGMGSRK
jgi:hypothetical protein